MDSDVATTATRRRSQAAGPPKRQGALWRGGTVLDGLLHAAQGRASGGLSPIAQGLAYLDWGVHLANAPFRRAQLAAAAVQQAVALRRRDQGRDGDRAATRRPSLSGSRLESAAVQSLRPGVSSRRGMVGRGGGRPAGNQRKRSARRRVRHTPMDRHVFAVERALAQSGGHPRDPANGRRQFPSRGRRTSSPTSDRRSSAGAAPRRSASGATSPPLPAPSSCATI